MNNNKKLFIVKLIHTIVWIIMAFCTFYVSYLVIIMKFNIPFFICLSILIIEIITMFYNRFVCPFQKWAGRYTDNREVGFDIFLPKIIANNNTLIFTILFILTIVIFIFNCIRFLWGI